MLETINVGSRSVDAYRGVAPDPLLDDLERAAEPLRGKRVLHLSATRYGGGVSELLRSIVPLLNGLGLRAEWKVIAGDDAFFRVTKRMHNALQGQHGGLAPQDREAYLANARRNAEAFGDHDYDFVFVHDPQPAAMLRHLDRGDARWVWRCHLDSSHGDPEVWEFLHPYLERYDAAVFTMRQFQPPDLPVPHVAIIPPAIDPLSPKNLALPDDVARQVLAWTGVELDQPLVTQVSRFDPWKDPLGVIAAYRQACESIPGLQLALVGSMALDDPEGWDIYKHILEEARRDPRIHVLTNVTGAGNIEVNALQRASDVVVQKSLREGFGLVVSEALWKGRPVVAGRVGGIPLQMADGVGGALVESPEACAEAIVRFHDDPALAGRVAARGQERVRSHFLLPRLLRDELSLMRTLAGLEPVDCAAIPAADEVWAGAAEAA